jgi:osmotically inducible protein OsmC
LNLKRRSRASWQGGVEDGDGRIALGSGAFEGAYSLKARVAGESSQTNPEELVAAALAGCFTMSLSNELTEAGTPPERLDTTATAYLQQGDDGFVIPRIVLEVTGAVDGVDEETFRATAERAERGCPVSKLYASAEIQVEARLA